MQNTLSLVCCHSQHSIDKTARMEKITMNACQHSRRHDRIQKNTQGYVVPDAFTHSTSEQRKHWFYKGYETGDINQGDTFANLDL